MTARRGAGSGAPDRGLRASEFRAPEEVLRSIVETLPARVFWKDRESRYLGCNTLFAQDAGYQSAADLIGKSDFEMAWKPQAQAYREDDERVMTTGIAKLGYEEAQTGPEGQTRWLSTSKTPLRDSRGRVIGILGTYQDITERKRSEERLRESEERYRSILNASPDGVAITDMESRVLMVSPMSLTMLGAEEHDVVGRPILDFIAPEDRALAASNLALRLKGLRAEGAEYRGLRLDGSRFDIEVNAAFIRNAEGRPAEIVITVRDITARKQITEQLASSLREKEGLLKETHHRVKNNLALITSLMRITGAQGSPETRAVLKEMEARIHSVVLLNETLYKTASYTKVSLADYLTQLATHAFRAQNAGTGEIRLILDLAPVDVATAQAIPCGLIVNELITNSLKHAFPGGPGGEVRIALGRDATGPVRLEVSDSGRGLPEDFELRRAKSLGLQLVTDLVRQLRGRLEIASGAGARFTVTFDPVASP